MEYGILSAGFLVAEAGVWGTFLSMAFLKCSIICLYLECPPFLTGASLASALSVALGATRLSSLLSPVSSYGAPSWFTFSSFFPMTTLSMVPWSGNPIPSRSIVLLMLGLADLKYTAASWSFPHDLSCLSRFKGHPALH